MNKEEIKEVIKKLQKGDNFNYYTNYGYAYSLLISDADTIIDYFEGMEQENKELQEKYNIRSKAYNNILLENADLHNKIDEISDFIKENKIKRYRVIESEDYDEEIVLDEDDITCLERIINDEYDYENR